MSDPHATTVPEQSPESARSETRPTVQKADKASPVRTIEFDEAITKALQTNVSRRRFAGG